MNHFKTVKSEAEWKAILSPGSFRVLRKKKTELPYINAFWRHFEKGVYCCKACGHTLFLSETKFRSWSGWPSFYQPAESGSVITVREKFSFTGCSEVLCAGCGSHQGHVFKDGPEPTGLRYCINSAALDFAA